MSVAKKEKKEKTRDPNMPRKPPNSFIMFLREQKLSNPELSRIEGVIMWKELDPKMKEEYKGRYEVALDKYNEELAAYEDPWDKYRKKRAAQEKKKQRAKSLEEERNRDPNMPIKPQNSFILFLRDIKPSNPDLSHDDTVKMWKDLDPTTKEEYKRRYKVAWDLYLEELAAYEKEKAFESH